MNKIQLYRLGDNCQLSAVRSYNCQIGQLSNRTTVSGPWTTVRGNCQCSEKTVRSYSCPLPNCQWKLFSFEITLSHNIRYNWIYPTSGPDRAHRHNQNCIYPRLFGLQIFFLKIYIAHNILYNWIFPTPQTCSKLHRLFGLRPNLFFENILCT